MPITTLNPNLLGTDSAGASKLSTAGGLVQLHSTGVFAIANNTANNLHIANTGLIGIGTIIPETFSARVAIASSNGTNESIPLTLVNANSSTNTAVSLGFAPNVNIDLARITALRTDVSGATDLQFKTHTGSSLTEKARVTANGNFGIANTAPANPLVVRSANAHIYLQQNNTDHGSILSGSVADGNFRIYRKDDSGTNERFSMATDGQMYHNVSYLLGSSYNSYYGKTTTCSNIVSGFNDTGLSVASVYIPTNVRKVFVWYHVSLRNNGLSSINHSGFRFRVVRASDSNVTYVGDASWGFGISQGINSTQSKNWTTVTHFVNLYDYDSNGNQAGLSAGNTYTFYLQATDAYGTGATLRIGGEGNGVHQTYTPQHAMIWIL